MKTKSRFDAVAFQRKVRQELGARYANNREGLLRDLRLKYGKHAKLKPVARTTGKAHK